MKHVLGKRRGSVWLFLVGLSLVSMPSLYGESEQQSLSFDKPFPPSPLDETVKTCTEVWGQLKLLCGSQGDDLSVSDREQIFKQSMGSAAYLKELGQTVRHKIPHEDSLYVAGIIDRAIQACPATPRHHVNDNRFSCMQSWLYDARKEFSGEPHLLKGDDTVIGTSE